MNAKTDDDGNSWLCKPIYIDTQYLFVDRCTILPISTYPTYLPIYPSTYSGTHVGQTSPLNTCTCMPYNPVRASLEAIYIYIYIRTHKHVYLHTHNVYYIYKVFLRHTRHWPNAPDQGAASTPDCHHQNRASSCNRARCHLLCLLRVAGDGIL